MEVLVINKKDKIFHHGLLKHFRYIHFSKVEKVEETNEWFKIIQPDSSKRFKKKVYEYVIEENDNG